MFHRKKPLVLFTLLLALHAANTRAAGADDSADNPLQNYKTQETATVTITYPADEQPFADAILQSYTFPLRLLDDAGLDAQLTRWKKHDLALLARELAIGKPTPAMDETFEQFRALCQPAAAEEIREIRIYDFADIKLAGARGIAIEGIGYVPRTDSVSISNYITAERPGAPKVRVVPIVLMQKVPGMTDEKMRLFNATLRDMRWRLDEAIYNAYCGKLFEIARPAIIATVDKARFPLWIIDGMTNALPLLVMRSHNPAISFAQLLQTHSRPPENFPEIASRINLDTWITTRTPSTPKVEVDAYSYLAMLAVLDAIQTSGDDWIPELFNRLRTENSPALNMASVYNIFSELTAGNDLHENINNVQDRLANPLGKTTATAKAAPPAPPAHPASPSNTGTTPP